MLRIFIGYDKLEPVVHHVCAHSILRRSSIPVSITPLNKASFSGFFSRERGQYDSTDFAITRFLVPFLCDFQGFAVFMDGDMVCLGDVAELSHYMTLMDKYNYAVRVVKHSYEPTEKTKFLRQEQTRYERKNWSSVMVFNNALCTALTPEYVEKAPGLALHQFQWCKDSQIADMPSAWNYLVGVYPKRDHIKLLHYTKGAPCFTEYRDCDYAQVWRDEYNDMVSSGT